MDTRLAVFPTDFGWMCAAIRGEVLCELTFGHASPQDAVTAMRNCGEVVADSDPFAAKLIQRLQKFCRNPADDFLDIELDLADRTEFQRAVIERCRRIPTGQTLTYAQLAEQAGRPGAARAVGQVMATNRFPLVVPCHRVLGSNGSLGGYSARDGLKMKLRLLAGEGVRPVCRSDLQPSP